MKDSKKVSLFLNTATKVLEAGLLYGDQALEVKLGNPKTALERTNLGIEMLLDSYDLKLADVDAFYCLLGPGSNTGIRLGLTIPRTIYSFNPKILCFGIPTLELMTEEVPYAAISDRNGNLYFGERKEDKTVALKRVDKKDIDSLSALPSIALEADDTMALDSVKVKDIHKVRILDLMIAYRSKFKDFSADEENYLPEYLLKI